MNIDPKEKIAGHPSFSIRSLLAKGYAYPWSVKFVEEVLNVDNTEANNVIEELRKQGYIERDHDSKDNIFWKNTIKGNALASAIAVKPISRKKAEKKVEAFLNRVAQVNNSDYYLYKVSKVCIFGSYITDKENLGDVDFAIQLIPKEPDTDKHFKLTQPRSNEVRKKEKVEL